MIIVDYPAACRKARIYNWGLVWQKGHAALMTTGLYTYTPEVTHESQQADAGHHFGNAASTLLYEKRGAEADWGSAGVGCICICLTTAAFWCGIGG